MPVLEFTSKNLPSPEEFRRLHRELVEAYDPLEELLRLEREFAEIEKTYQMSSEDFYQRYQAGEMGDDMVFIHWAGKYTLYLRLKRAISNSLKQIVAVDTISIS